MIFIILGYELFIETRRLVKLKFVVHNLLIQHLNIKKLHVLSVIMFKGAK